MAPAPVPLGLTPTLLFHATGAVTFLAEDAELGWDDDAGVFAVQA